MTISNVFDAVLEGNADEFHKHFDNNINQVNKFTKLNLLSTAVLSDNNPNGRMEIIKYLLSNGIDVKFTDSKFKRNALHTLFFNFVKGSASFVYDVAKILIEYLVDVNGTDKFNAIALKYAITIPKGSTDELRDIYILLVKSGSDLYLNDSFGKSCLDYAKEYTWRNDFINIVKEYEYGRA